MALVSTAAQVAPELDARFLDKLSREGYCPGFRLWDALASDGQHYLVAADNEGGAENRLFFRTNGALKVVEAKLLGDNPDVAAWDAARARSRKAR
jgi:hypothetical protein